MNSIDVKRCLWAEAANSLSSIRRDVFVTEQAVPQEMEWDGQDESAWHLLAIKPDGSVAGKAVGCARLLRCEDGSVQIGRLAVLKPHRHQGVATALMRAAWDWAIELADETVFLNAQCYAIGLYERLGFAAVGEPFDEVGISHQRLQRNIELPESVTSAAESLPWLRRLLRDAKAVDVVIDSRAWSTFSDRKLIERLKKIALRGNGLLVRILTDDINPALRCDHPIVAVAQSMPSKFSVRRLSEDSKVPAGLVLLVPGHGWVACSGERGDPWRFSWGRSAGLRQQSIEFDRWWQRSSAESALRVLAL